MNKTNIEKANQFIQDYKDNVTNRPEYHATGDVGWINDPNGFVYFNGEYHLFYQYHPYSTEWGPMHWGHVKSKDLVSWTRLNVALAPDKEYDKDGCFSGSAIEHDGKLYLMYTGFTNPNLEKPEDIRQVQCLAVSEDGINFEKVEQNPVIDIDQLPNDVVISDFRDPKVWKKDGIFYCVVGSRHKDDSGQILLYKSTDLFNWEFVNIIVHSNNEFGKMWECPDLFELDGSDVLIMSPQFLETNQNKYKNIHSSTYMIGELDYVAGNYNYNKEDEIDYGFDFYAPQTLIDNKGRRIMVAWMQMWDRNQPSKEFGWAGSMTLPRVLEVKNNQLYQYPVEEIKHYRQNEVTRENIILNGTKLLEDIKGNVIELELEVDLKEASQFGLNILKSKDEETKMYYNKANSEFVFDRSKSGVPIKGVEKDEELNKGIRRTTCELTNNTLTLRVLVDQYSVEIFINEGERVMSSTVFPRKESVGVELFSDDEVDVKRISKWDLIINK